MTVVASGAQGEAVRQRYAVLVGPQVGEMVYVPAGSFPMGCDPAVPGAVCADDARPVHQVLLAAYFIDRYEVTNGRYRACVEAGACSPPQPVSSATRALYYGDPQFDAYPVVNVDWAQARAYCAWVGKGLPSEAQWEKAARGPAGGRLYPWGDAAPGCALLNFRAAGGYCVGDSGPVGSHPGGASPYGVLDMAGSVWEWTADWYGADYYGVSPAADPPGPAGGVGRVLRGGSWWDDGDWAQAARRTMDNPAARYDRLGFRCAWEP